MASSKVLLDAIESRRSIYATSPENPPATIDRVEEIVSHIIKHTPSPYNFQFARAIILSGDQHTKYWSAVYDGVQKVVPKEAWEGHLAGFLKMFRDTTYGTVMWFEDEDAVNQMKAQKPEVAAFAESWSDQSSGMHQINGMIRFFPFGRVTDDESAWTALEAEGFGATLQHMHFAPDVQQYICE